MTADRVGPRPRSKPKQGSRPTEKRSAYDLLHERLKNLAKARLAKKRKAAAQTNSR